MVIIVRCYFISFTTNCAYQNKISFQIFSYLLGTLNFTNISCYDVLVPVWNYLAVCIEVVHPIVGDQNFPTDEASTCSRYGQTKSRGEISALGVLEGDTMAACW